MLLKLVIAEMNAHDAVLNPHTFAVCYEHLAGINPGLSQAFADARQASARLSTTTMRTLHQSHVAAPEASMVAASQLEFERLMGMVSASADRTGDSARAYGSQLAGLTQALMGGSPGAKRQVEGGTDELSPQLSELTAGTHHMQSMVQSLQDTVAEGRRSIVRLQQSVERLRIEACTDPLSKLLNRKGFDDAMQRMLSAPPPAGHSHCIVVLDIDHFKRVNDTYGHPVGDSVIEAMGQVLSRVSQGADVRAARIGGEEFALLLPASTTTRAVQTAQAARSVVSRMRLKKRGSQEAIAAITVSAGVAAWVPGDDAMSLIASADAALYRAKAAGRDQVTVA
ncbi:MAG: GGDEF domain-containing protein [Rubrivivax sp.]